jgi:hypothetical protein
MMQKMKISKQKRLSDHESKEGQEDKHDENEEEIVDVKPKKAKKEKKTNVRKAKKIDRDAEFMNSEKEKYLSRLANGADLISSSESEPDDESDESFDVSQVVEESDSVSSETSKVSSGRTSSIASSVAFDESSNNPDEESYVSELSPNTKKKMYNPSEGTLWSGARKKKAI